MKTKLSAALAALAFFALAANASAGGSSDGDGLTLMKAIEQSAEQIAGELPRGSRVAIVAFDSESVNLSEFIMEELTGALLDRKIEVANRRNLEHVYKELNFQMSGDVSDESALSIGKFLGANLVVYGQLRNIGATYRFTTNNDSWAYHDRCALYRDLKKDYQSAMADANRAVQLNPNDQWAFAHRGWTYLAMGDVNRAITDLEAALRLDPNNAEVKKTLEEIRRQRGR